MIKLLLNTLLIFLFLGVQAQEVVSYRTADLQDSPAYDLSGTAYLELLDDGTFRFRLGEDYVTDSGPDVQLLLTNNDMFSSPIQTSNTITVVDVGTGSGGISHFSGELIQELGNGVSALEDFDHVVFVCVQFGNLYWGHGSFGQVMDAEIDCSVANIDVSVSLEDQTLTAGASGSVYQWVNCNENNAIIEGETSQSFTPDESGSYAVIIADVDCSAMSECIEIMDEEIDCSNTNIDVSVSLVDQTFTAGATDLTYQWVNCNENNALIEGETSQSYTAEESGSYAVTITDSECSATSECVELIIVSVNEEIIEEDPISIYPNPTTDGVTLTLNTDKGSYVRVKNILGETISESELSGESSVKFELKEGVGLYFVELTYGDQVIVKKVVKR